MIKISQSRRVIVAWLLPVFFCGLILLCSGYLGSIWVTLGARGLQADETGTRGFITETELILLVLCPLGLIIGATGLVISLAKSKTSPKN